MNKSLDYGRNKYEWETETRPTARDFVLGGGELGKGCFETKEDLFKVRERGLPMVAEKGDLSDEWGKRGKKRETL